MKNPYVKIAVCVALCLGLGSISGFFTIDSIRTWYPTLQKPSWNPPNWVFGPVWSLLYILMGVAAALVWSANDYRKNRALLFFSIQFLLNLLWSYIFFGKQQVAGAFYELLFLWVAIAITMRLFYKIKPIAGWLMPPYLLWVNFAGYLNYTVYILNR